MPSPSRAERALGAILPVLAIVAEGALLAVVYASIQAAVDHRPALIGTLELAAGAGVAALAVRRRWLNPDEDLGRFIGLLAVLGLAGWLWDAEVRRLVLAGDPLAAVPLHPGGWLMVVAGMRGVGRGIEVDDRAMTRLVLVGVPALAIPWLIGELGAGPLRSAFREEAFVSSITFVTAGFSAAGLARLAEIGRETGVDWRQNRSWLGTVVGVIAVVLALGIPTSILLGLPGDAVARGILGPLVTATWYLVIGFLTVAAVFAAVISAALRTAGFILPDVFSPEQLARLPQARVYEFDELRGPLTAVLVGAIVLAVVIIVVVRVWLRQRGPRRARSMEERRTFQIPDRSTRARPERPAPAPAVRRSAPTDAVTAYLASLDEIAANDPARTRAEHETPRRHALRAALGTELAALQADYALARYGERTLTAAEDRRALGRWRRLRARLRGA